MMKSELTLYKNEMYSLNPAYMFQTDENIFVWSEISQNALKISPDVYDILTKLKESDYSFDEFYNMSDINLQSDELYEILNKLCELGIIEKHNKHCKPFTSFNLFLTNNCNLNCLYCYGGSGRKEGELGGSYGFPIENMKFDVGKAVIDYLIMTCVKNRGEMGGLNFFGGEPLMNYKGLKEIVLYAEKQCSNLNIEMPRFSMTTNGTIMTQEIIDFCKQYEISIQISLDGAQETQDTIRPFRTNNDSCYTSCEKTIKLLIANDLPIKIRATITNKNLKIYEIVKHMETLGVKSVHFAVASVESESNLRLTKQSIDILIQEYKKISKYMLDAIKDNRQYVKCNNIISIVSEINKKKKTQAFCGAGIGLAGVAPNGDIYVCHRFAGEDTFKIGNILKGIDYRKRYEFIKQSHIDTHTDCMNCWCKALCGGECHYTNFYENGCVNKPNELMCHLYRGMVEIGIEHEYLQKSRKNEKI